ncbi:MAG: tRNA pseudouridine(38-40) synthase TruA [Anaerolineales bacterium]
MARYQIVLAYDGTRFFGSQRQAKPEASTIGAGSRAAKSRTVQGELERALTRLGWQGKSVLLAGRTDSGVHASGQVASFDHEWNHPLEELVSALNANLPTDVAVSAAKIVPDEFHPRFDATSRRYCYRLFCQKRRDPLRERYAWRVWPALDEDALHNAARLFLGMHDFAAFGSPPRPESSTVRTVMKSEWQLQGDGWTFEVQADGFLYRMVRKLVHVQVAVGQGRLSAQVIADALEGRPRGVPGGLAPANGLTLVEVTYPVAIN